MASGAEITLLLQLTHSVAGCSGVSDNGDGTYRVDFADGTSRLVTDAEILAATKAFRLTEIRAEAATCIEAVYPAWRQRSAALGLYPSTYVSQMQSAIASVIAASNTAEDAIDAATTLAQVEAVTVTWPVI